MNKKYRWVVLFSLFFIMQQAIGQVVINEYSCSNLTQFPDNYGKYEDWFELYNKGSLNVNLGGYYLSDDSVNNLKWPIPAGIVINPGGFKRFWASGRDIVIGSSYHTSFKLTQTKNNSEFLVLSDPSGVITDYVKLTKKTHLGHSRGRTLNGATAWSIFTSPTPNASNNTATPYSRYANRPDMSLPAGFYNSPVTVYITTTEPNADIHYTLNGTAPSVTSSLYSTPLNVPNTRVIKAITISADPEVLPSLVEFNTYFINVSHSVVVLSISGTNLDVLANGNSSLEPHGSFEYFDLNQQRVASTYGEYNKHGQDSWSNSQRSIDFISRDEMAYNHSIEEMMFYWSPRKNFQRIIIRAAGDDNYPADHHAANEGSAHLRDAYVHSLADIGILHLDVRRSEKTVVYLNGQYWGVYDLRERCDDHDYTDYYYGQDKYHLQYLLLWGSTWAEYGGSQAMTDWDNFYSWIMSHNMANQSDFQYVADRLDYASLVDYVIVNSFTVCSDWLNWNVGWWRGMDSLGSHLKWGYVLWDNDATFGHYINYTGIPDTTPYADPCNPEALTGGSDPEGHIVLLNRLRQNPEFQRYYVSRQIDLWNTVFSCHNMLSQLDSTKAIINPEMAMHAARWNGTYSEWQNNYQRLRNFIAQRCNYLSTGFIDCYGLTGPYNLVIRVDPPDAGSVVLNSIPLLLYPWTGTYFGNIDTRLVAYPNAGYVFDNWSSGNQSFLPGPLSDSVAVNLNSSDTLVAHFSLYTGIKPLPFMPETPSFMVFPSLVRNYLSISVDLPTATKVTVKLFTPLGQEVNAGQQISGMMPAGKQNLTMEMSGKGLSPGVYLLEISTHDYKRSFKIVYSPL